MDDPLNEQVTQIPALNTEDVVPDNVTIGIQDLVEYAARLNLIVRYKLGRMSGARNDVHRSIGARVELDGDTGPIIATSLIGMLPGSTRVMVMFVPPAGAYIIGRIDSPRTATPWIIAGGLGSPDDSLTPVRVMTTAVVTVDNDVFEAYDSNTDLVFTAPPTGRGDLRYKIRANPMAATQRVYASPRVRTGSVPGSGTIVSNATDGDSLHVTAAVPGDLWMTGVYRSLENLTPGATYNAQLLLRATDTGTASAPVQTRGMMWDPDLA